MGDRRPAPRVPAIDLARGVAVLLMIASHATDAFLAGQWKTSDLWHGIDLLFGYVAPGFAFLAGMALWQGLGGHRQTDGETERRYAWRYLRILLLGYWLQIPILSLRQLLWVQRPDELARMFDANILQVIAIAGMLVLGAARIMGSAERARLPLLLLAVAGIIATPYLWRSDLSILLPLPLRAYLSPHPPSTFPLLPYGAYLLLGFVMARPLAEPGRRRGARMVMPLLGCACMAAGLVLDIPLASHPPHDDFWGSSAQHVLFRLGGIILGVSLCLTLARRGRGWLRTMGRSSLAIYLLHLMLIYGSPMTMGARYWNGGALDRSLGPLATVLAIVLVALLCYHAVRGWDVLRHRRPAMALWGKRLWWGTFWALFLLIP